MEAESRMLATREIGKLLFKDIVSVIQDEYILEVFKTLNL